MKKSRFFPLLALWIVFSFVLSTASVQAGPVGAGPDGFYQDEEPPDDPLADIMGGESAVTDADPMKEMPVGKANPIEDFAPATNAEVTLALGAWRNLRPTESYLRDVSMLPKNVADSLDCVSPDQRSKGWIVGDSGVILSYCNGVWDHAIVVESIPTNLFGIQAITPTLGVAVGDQGAVLMYLYDTVAGDWVWTKSPIPVGNQRLYNVSMVSDGSGGYTGWAVGVKDASGHGTLVRGTISPVQGSSPLTYAYSWENVTANYPELPGVNFYFGLQMLSPTNGWAVGGTEGERGVILHWNGSSWSVFQEVGNHALIGLRMVSANNGWAVGNHGVVYHYNGTSWSEIPSPTTDLLFDIGFNSDGEGWVVGLNGTLLKYESGNWTIFNDLRSDPFDFWAVDFTSDHGWLVGYNEEKTIGGQILEYDEGLWLAVTPPTDNRLNDVTIISDNDAWAVGAPDGLGGTIIHWDGRHWQRWFQMDMPIPAVNLFAVEMSSATEGWAAGDPPTPGAPAVFLRWDGHRWAQTRFLAPLNVRVNAIALLDKDLNIAFGGWAVADNGNAVAKWDGLTEYWTANHTHQGIYYQLRDTSIITATTQINPLGWDAWALGTSLNPATGEYFLRYRESVSGSGYAWDAFAPPPACDGNTDGPSQTKLFGIAIHPDQWGLAVGRYKDRATIYGYNGSSWTLDWCELSSSDYRPSQLYATDIVEESGVGWYGGYFTSKTYGRKWAYIFVSDAGGLRPVWDIFPVNGKNVYHRPILAMEMSSETMGWAVGDGEDPANRSVIYQYPHPNFTLTVDPQSRAVLPGGSASYTINVNSLGDLDTDIDLNVLHSIPGATVGISSNPLSAGASGTITVNTGAGTPLGEYELILVGSATIRSGDNDVPVLRYTTFNLTVTDHPVYSVMPDHGPAGTEVTIAGANFGPDPGAGNRSTAMNHVTLAGGQLPDSAVISWANNQLKVIIPDDSFLFPHGPQLGEVSVTAGGSKSNADLTFQLENYLDGITVEKDGDVYTVTLTGTSLGNDPGSLFRSTALEHVSLNETRIANNQVLNWSNNLVTISLPITTTSGQLAVTSNGYQSNKVLFIPGISAGAKDIFLPLTIKQ